MLLPQFVLFSCHRALLALNRQTILRGNFGYLLLSVDVTGLKFKSLLAKKKLGSMPIEGLIITPLLTLKLLNLTYN